MTSSKTTADQHDDFGRIRKEVSPYSGTRTYLHDADGNLTSYTDPNGGTTATSYDPLNRPLSSTATKGTASETTTWSYDDGTSGTYRLGRLYQITDPSGSQTYTYDRRGNVTTAAQVVGSTTYSTSYGYDGNGNRTSITLPSGRALTYAFDYADRPYSVSGTYSGSPTTYVSSATYAPFGPRLSSAFGNGTTQTFSYNQRYLLTENKLIDGGTTLSDLTYAENNAGYVTSVTDALNAAYDQTYAYGGNSTNMLTNATTGSSLWGTARYADAYAQTLTQAFFPGRMLAFKLAQSNAQLQSVFNQGTGTSTPVTFDAAGNESAIGSASYTYSPRNLLATGDGITYVYDGFGQRVSATTTISGSSATETSLYDPNQHLQTETSLSSGSIAYDYVWFAGAPVAEEDIGGSHTYWTAVDHLGAPNILTNASGAIAWQADYEPFGLIYQVRTGSSIHQPLRFPGQESEVFDGSQGANGFSLRYYNAARWYRPQWGRYTQPDPIGYAGSPYNLYGYVGNNPVNYTDPVGLYLAILVTRSNGTTYMPLTTIKNGAEAGAYNEDQGTQVPIAVPPGVYPQTQVNQWSSADPNANNTGFAQYWMPGGAHDYKNGQYPNAAMYDPYGNFMYGATGAAANISCGELQNFGDLLHPLQGFNNFSENKADIASGFNAIANGGSLSTRDYEPAW